MITLQITDADVSSLTLHFSTLKSNHQFSTGLYLGKRMVNPCSTSVCPWSLLNVLSKWTTNLLLQFSHRVQGRAPLQGI